MFNDGDDDRSGTYMSNGANNLAELNQHNTPLDGDLLKPLCHHPKRLIGRSIESLTPSDFFCGTPKLQVVEVDLGQLTDFYGRQNYGIKQISVNSEEENNTSLTVTVRCHVKGSPELQIDWYRPALYSNDTITDQKSNFQSNLFTQIQDHQQFIRIPNTKLLRSGGIELKLSRQINLKNENEIKGKNNGFKSSSTIEKLICFATDSNGNTSAEIVFHWPTFENLQIISANAMNMRTKLKSPQNDGKDVGENNVYADKSRINKDRSSGNYELTPGWYTVLQDDPENMLFQKQFSVLEMIGAVVGTFTATLTFFVFGYCLLRFHRRSRYKVRSKILLHHTTSENSYRNFSPASENLKSPPYSVTNNHIPSNDSNNNNISYSVGAVPNTLMNSYTTSNFLTRNGTPVNEFSGMKRLPYTTATYEPINCSGDFPTSTGYSDSQTYDLPQILPTHSPPAIPLPPLPNGFMNSNGRSSAIGRTNENERENGNSSDNNIPLLMTTMPYMTTSPSVNDVNRCVDASVLSPLLMNDSRTLSAAMSAAAAAATLNLHMKQQQNSQNQQFNTNNKHLVQQNQYFTQSTTNDNILVQNQLLDLITRQNLLSRQLRDTQH
ncbi:unnamed protein product [Heterobilharzia americana]|nr:unnamed protein product [Heterobilharzia americana]